MASHHRFSAWVALFAFSVFCLAANVNVDDSRERIFFAEAEKGPTKMPQRKWVTSMTSISMVVAIFSIIAHFVFREKFVGTRIEKGAALFLIAMWAAGLPVIMNPNNEIAQAGLFIIDYNLFFFSWLAFDTALIIFGSLQKATHKVQMWSALVLSSAIVVGSSTRLYRDSTCMGGRFEVDCERIKWAIGLGASCTAISLVVGFLVSYEIKIGIRIETFVAILIMILYALGVGYITFGNGAGALVLGNLLFYTWAGFLLALLLSSDLFYEVVEQHWEAQEEKEPAPEEQAKLDVEEVNVEVTTSGVKEAEDDT